MILAPKARLLSARLMSPTGIKAQYLDISHLKYTVSCGDEDKAKVRFVVLVKTLGYKFHQGHRDRAFRLARSAPHLREASTVVN